MSEAAMMEPRTEWTGEATMPASRTLRAYLTEAKYESLRMLRTPSFAAIFLSLPVLLYLFFAVVLFGSALRTDKNAAIAVFTGFSVFGVIGPAMFGFGVTIAIEREQGLLQLKRALPMPSASYLVAKMSMAVLFAAIIMVSMEIAAVFIAHVPLTPAAAVSIGLINTFGALPFCAIGLFIGSLVKGSAAPGFTHLIYLPMVYLSGLFFPLPHSLQVVAPIWPAYHLDCLIFAAAGGPRNGQASVHIGALIGVTVLFGLLSWRSLRRAG